LLEAVDDVESGDQIAPRISRAGVEVEHEVHDSGDVV
jgi:hypothetical protein